MRPLLSPQEMARADKAAIEAGTPDEVLMERAGRAVARAVIRIAGGRYGKRAAIVCGKGNNGGDGFVAARVLRGFGMGVRCLGVGDLSATTPAAAANLGRLAGAGLHCEPFDQLALDGAEVIVDALFGTGFHGKAKGEAAKAIEAMNDHSAPVVAVDVPSGVDGATGDVQGPGVKAEITVAFAAQKLGTALAPGAAYAGTVEVVDIGIPFSAPTSWMIEPADVAGVLPRREWHTHKRSAGSVALLAGSEGMSGAALLAARAAVRAGAGYATLGCSAAVDRIASAVLPEVLTSVVAGRGSLGPDALERFGEVLERSGAVAVGPGLGRAIGQRALVEAVLERVGVPVVLDADALNVLAGDTAPLVRRDAPAVITPHPGEMAGLLGMSTTDIQADRRAAALIAAARFGCVVVLKGFRSVIADPAGTAVVNPTGGPQLASAGTGDVLTGVITALAAAGLDPFAAAWAGAYVHGVAGDLAARTPDGSGVLAWDVAEALPEAAALCAAPA